MGGGALIIIPYRVEVDALIVIPTGWRCWELIVIPYKVDLEGCTYCNSLQGRGGCTYCNSLQGGGGGISL